MASKFQYFKSKTNCFIYRNPMSMHFSFVIYLVHVFHKTQCFLHYLRVCQIRRPWSFTHVYTVLSVCQSVLRLVFKVFLDSVYLSIRPWSFTHFKTVNVVLSVFVSIRLWSFAPVVRQFTLYCCFSDRLSILGL